MQVTFELTQQDLEDVQELLSVRRRERIYGVFRKLRSGPYWKHALFNGAVGLVAGLLLWPAARAMAGFGFPVILFAVGVAALVATWIQRRFGLVTPRHDRLYRWSSKRQGKVAASRSVLGTVSVAVSEEGLVRTNSTGTLTIPWKDVKLLASNSKLLLAQLRNGKVIALPARAFADDGSRAAFGQRLSTLASRELEAIP